MMIVLSACAVALCLGIVAQLVYEDIETRREMARPPERAPAPPAPPYMPRHRLRGHDTVQLQVAAVRAPAQKAEAAR